MPRALTAIRRLTLTLVVVGAACSVPSRADLEMAQSMQDLSAEVNAVRQDMGLLADQIDSLRNVVTKQDSVVRTLANLAGVSFPR
ncbi:MAG: hypothetical protein AB1762_17045 [Gemmatimonadota bacterium]